MVKDKVARLLNIDQIDGTIVSKAALSCQRQDKEYWDALSYFGQLHGNVPRLTMISLIYARMTNES